jgi:TIR domain-containing protein
MSDQPIRVFVSYSHRDAEYLAENSLLGFLRGLEREGAEFWTDEGIAAGDKWDDEIRSKILQTDIALVLVSQSFLDSEYCTSIEIAGFLDRSREAGMVIFPVILSPCEWERHSWLRSTQYLPGDGATIEEDFLESGIRKRLFLDIRSNLREQIEKLRRLREESSKHAAPAKRPILGERRQITALACELTALEGSGSLDPEEVAQILPEFRSPRRADRRTARRPHRPTPGPAALGLFRLSTDARGRRPPRGHRRPRDDGAGNGSQSERSKQRAEHSGPEARHSHRFDGRFGLTRHLGADAGG